MNRLLDDPALMLIALSATCLVACLFMALFMSLWPGAVSHYRARRRIRDLRRKVTVAESDHARSLARRAA